MIVNLAPVGQVAKATELDAFLAQMWHGAQQATPTIVGLLAGVYLAFRISRLIAERGRR